MKVMITNDDGIQSLGLDALAMLCAARGWEVVVVAPVQDMSGSSAAIGRLSLDESVHLHPSPRAVEGAAESFVVDGAPGLAALVSCRGAIGPAPDLVLSGVNAGENTGHAILHSGTVGAALTAASFGVSALAVSVQVTDPMRWDTAAHFAGEALEGILAAQRGTVLNLNVPARPVDDVREIRWARLDRFGSFRVAVASREGTALQLELRATDRELDPDSDSALLEAGHPTLTAIEGIGEIPVETLRRRPTAPAPEPQERLTRLPRSAR